MTQPIKIHLNENAGIARHAEIVQLGIPFPKNQGLTTPSLHITDTRTDTELPCQLKPLCHWPDGSIRWLSVAFPVTLNARESICLLAHPHLSAATQGQLLVTTEGDTLTVNTGANLFQLHQHHLHWKTTHSSTYVELIDEQGIPCTSHTENGWKILENGPLFLELQTKGHWRNSAGAELALFNCRLRFQRGSQTVIIDLCIHNPRRALHNGGLWDLGDPGSIHFRSLQIITRYIEDGPIELQPHQDAEIITARGKESLRIHQNSSGGEHWHNKNHINAKSIITTDFRGYQIYRNDTAIGKGERAAPIIRFADIQASTKQFWQQFPSALSAGNQQLAIQLFPPYQGHFYELQAGERKSKISYLNYSANTQTLAWTRSPLLPRLEPSSFKTCAAFPWFDANAVSGQLEALIQRGIDGPSSFFNKREIIDEYSWRNFGDLFADHESHNQPAGAPPLISHYNNQYDPVYGFARQFALSGDSRWFELMDDLARHVVDIDIYHTIEDRAEYNNGLFWHTDHYLDAHTSTHRTYTRHNSTSSVAGQTGGGPAAEHCYTMGLLYHYLLTGHEPSRDAVLELTGWITKNQEGIGCALDQLVLLKKIEIPQLKALMKGQAVSPHRYPFTRGTGNYLNAILDAWQLTLEPHWLQQADSVISATIHPADDINQRDLLDAETRWSYLVLLAAIVKYLQMKIEAGQIDGHYHFARDALTHYTRWIVQHERPFLSIPGQLEFPNHTWVAQDIRKAMLMFQAAQIDPDWSDRYLAKGQEWLNYVTSTLQDSPEAHYTRILAILMLNHGPHQIKPGQYLFPASTSPNHYPAPQMTWGILAKRIALRIIKGINNFSPAKERAWLKARLN